MSVKLITGIPNAGKTTWTNEHCEDGIIIHTDDLYYSRYRDVPEHILKKLEHFGGYNAHPALYLDTFIEWLADDEKTYYLEGSHIMWHCSLPTLEKYLYKIILCDPEIAYKCDLQEECHDPDTTLDDFLRWDNTSRLLAIIFPDLVIDLNNKQKEEN